MWLLSQFRDPLEVILQRAIKLLILGHPRVVGLFETREGLYFAGGSHGRIAGLFDVLVFSRADGSEERDSECRSFVGGHRANSLAKHVGLKLPPKETFCSTSRGANFLHGNTLLDH